MHIAGMSSTTDFVAELFVAANMIGKVSIFERRRLLERALATIRDMSDLVGRDSRVTVAERLQAVQALTDEIDTLPDPIASHALCEAADLIRGFMSIPPKQLCRDDKTTLTPPSDRQWTRLP